ncbi:peptidoglycan-binding domain-containing protein [Methylobacter tundripaludum]|uniref:peptidoglycan-binding domain-containing protein n=1 Tax=Methylobacter tundripaludum TaxID=173365 RepID=UPI00068F7CA6|nr:peptidoglycan-binding domain-containing protein [Methylobacter tundripaludum]
MQKQLTGDGMLLKRASTGANVKKLQTRLGLTANGIFGAETEEKVKPWQAQNGLLADGIVGNATWIKLFPQLPADDRWIRLKGVFPSK